MALSINIERPGSYYEFTFTSSAGGFTPLPLEIALLGVPSTAGTKTTEGEEYRVLSPEEADTFFGRGSELALMCRAAFAVGSVRGFLPAIYGVPVAEPSGGGAAKTTTTITIAGTPTENSDLVVRIAGRTFTVPVTTASTPTTIAADLESLIDAAASVLPVTASVAAGTVTCINVVTGANGNEVLFEAVNTPAGLTNTITQTVAGAGTSDPQNALDALASGRDYNALALANNTAGDVTKAVDHVSSSGGAWDPANKLWRRVWFGENGSLADATTLAAADDFRISVAALRNARSLPGEIAAACAALSYSEDRANYNFDAALLPLYGGAQSDAWTGAEIESLLDGGVSPLQPSQARSDRAVIEKLVTTQVTINSVPSFVLRDIVVPKVAAFVARQIDAQYGILRPETTDAIRDIILQVDRAAESLGLIRNVETHKPGVIVVEDDLVSGRANATNPIEVVLPLHQAVFAINVLV